VHSSVFGYLVPHWTIGGTAAEAAGAITIKRNTKMKTAAASLKAKGLRFIEFFKISNFI
jgi:hypothetical protein